ncbi:unnamed protein product [Urochloa humidicola]
MAAALCLRAASLSPPRLTPALSTPAAALHTVLDLESPRSRAGTPPPSGPPMARPFEIWSGGRMETSTATRLREPRWRRT